MKNHIAVLGLAAFLALAPSAHAAVTNEEILAKLEKIEARQEQILADLGKVREELNIVKVRVSLRA